jgi:TonB family protein
MSKLLTGITIFIFTLVTGIGMYFVWYLPIQLSNQEIVSLPLENSIEFEPTKNLEESIVPRKLKIEPCTERNNITQPSSDWKGKGVIFRGVVNCLALCGALPEYPLEAKKKNVSGVVTVNVLIDETGEVKEAKASNGHLGLLESAVKAAKQTRFAPTLLGGAGYKAKGILMYKFDIEKGTWLQDPSAPDNPFKLNRQINSPANDPLLLPNSFWLK